MSKVLVTGGSGFLGGHAILALLTAGHEVRTTVRDPQRADRVLAMLKTGGIIQPAGLTFATADLASDAAWGDAAAGCDYILHVASPFPATNPKHEDELIGPARDGTLRVLRAARAAGVKRVVLTSSFAAIGYGHGSATGPFDETCWTNITGEDVAPYIKSKTLAERAAWEYISGDGRGLELAVINPVGIFGPVLGPNLAASVAIIQRLMNGDIAVCPRIYFGLVDVRDVAELHLRAMLYPAASGQRFIAVAGDTLSLLDVAKLLRQRLGPAARKVPRFQLPDWIVRLAARRNRALRQVVPQLGRVRRSTSAKAQRLLDWSPRSNEDTVAATAESLLRLGILK